MLGGGAAKLHPCPTPLAQITLGNRAPTEVKKRKKYIYIYHTRMKPVGGWEELTCTGSLTGVLIIACSI